MSRRIGASTAFVILVVLAISLVYAVASAASVRPGTPGPGLGDPHLGAEDGGQGGGDPTDCGDPDELGIYSRPGGGRVPSVPVEASSRSTDAEVAAQPNQRWSLVLRLLFARILGITRV